MKKGIIFLLVSMMTVSLFTVSGLAETEKEKIFSETFEGDLSRWEYELPPAFVTIKNYEEYKNAEEYKRTYIGSYVELFSTFARNTDVLFGTKEPNLEKKNRIKTPVFDVEPKETYTFAYDLNMANLRSKQASIEVVYYDENEKEIERELYNMKYQREIENKQLGLDAEVWRCAYQEFTVPLLARKVGIEILSPVKCDNIIIVKGYVGFQPEIKNRIKHNIKAIDHSDIHKEIQGLIFFESFEEELDEWTPSSTNSKKGIYTSENDMTFGDKSLRFSSKYANEPVGTSSKQIPVVPNNEYTLTAHMKRDNGRSLNAYLNFLDINGMQIKSETVKSDSVEWKEHSITATAPENAHSAQIRFVSAAGKGEAYADKVRLVESAAEVHNKETSEPKETDKTETKSNKFVLTIGKKEADVFGETKTNDVAPVIRNGRTMLPARFVAENLGAEIIWNSNEPKRIVVRKDDIEIIMEIDTSFAYVNGEKKELDSPLFIENDRTYCPVRFICENLQASVEWNSETQQVTITKK